MKTTQVPFTSPMTFEIYVKCIYAGRFYITADDAAEYIKKNACYALGATMGDMDFKDAVIDALIDKQIREDMCWGNIDLMVYPNIQEWSKHRKLAVECALNFWKPEDFKTFHKQAHSEEFKSDLLDANGSEL